LQHILAMLNAAMQLVNRCCTLKMAWPWSHDHWTLADLYKSSIKMTSLVAPDTSKMLFTYMLTHSFQYAQPSTHCLMLLGPNLAKQTVQAGKYKSVVQALCFVVAFEASHDLKQPHLLHSTQQSTQQMRSQCRKSSCAISSLCILPIVTTSWLHHRCEHILSGEYIPSPV